MLPTVVRRELPLVNLIEERFGHCVNASSPKIVQFVSSSVTSFKYLEFANALAPINSIVAGIVIIPISLSVPTGCLPFVLSSILNAFDAIPLYVCLTFGKISIIIILLSGIR